MNWSSKHQRIIVDTAERQIVPIPGLAFGFPYPDGSEKCRLVIGIFWLKAYAAAAMVKWYNSLHTDSAEYKMWGNGIALPNAAYVLAGIADALANTVVEQA